MFQLITIHKFSIIVIVLLIALTVFGAFGQTPTLAPSTREEKLALANQTLDGAFALLDQHTFESYQAGREKFLAARRLYREIGEKRGEAKSLVGAGFISNNLGEKQAALEYFAQALPLFQAISDKYWEALTGNNIGSIYSDRGEKQKALEYFNQSLPLYRAVGDKGGEAVTLNNIGLAYSDLGEKQKALEFYNQSLPIRRAIGDRQGEAVTLSNIGLVYDDLGDKRKALELFNQSLSLAYLVGNKHGQAGTLSAIGKVYDDLGEKRKALEFFNQSLLLDRALGNKSGEALTLISIGRIYSDLGEKRKALEYYNQSLSLVRFVNNKKGETAALNNIGKVYDDLGEKQQALKFYNEALQLFRVVGVKRGEAVTLSNVMFVWESLKNNRLATFYGKQSVNKYQELRQAIQGLDKEIQKTFLGTIEYTYRKLADLLITEGRFAEAQQVLALLKEEEYFEYVRRDPDEIKNLKNRVKLRPEEQKLIQRYELFAGKITQIGAEFERLDDKKRKLPEGAALPAEEQKRYDQLSAQLADANAAFRLFLEKQLVTELSKPVKKEIDVDRALQEKLRQWGEGAVALYTVAGEDRYRVILTTPTVQVDGKTEIKAAELNKKIFAFREALQNPMIDPRPIGKELYDILIKPIEKDLEAANAKTLIWSLDGTLRYIPLAALSPDGKTYLVEKYQSGVITSATRQSLAAENQKKWQALGLGVSTAQTVSDPVVPNQRISFSALPGVKNELATIVRDEQTPGEKGLLLGKRLIDADFNAKNFSDWMIKETPDGKRKYTIVHIASHFRLGDDAANSFLLLGGGNTLTMEQISNSPQMRFGNVELVTLSACNTAFGSGDPTGKEVDSLSTFIELRGAKAILATLWAVADESTALLMSKFYRLKKENPTITKAEAMQQAQIAMIQGKIKPSEKLSGCRSDAVSLDGSKQTNFKCDAKAPFAHPYFWSPFVLIGNWR